MESIMTTDLLSFIDFMKKIYDEHLTLREQSEQIGKYTRSLKANGKTFNIAYDYGQVGNSYESLFHYGSIYVSMKDFEDCYLESLICELPSVIHDYEQGDADTAYFKKLGLNCKIIEIKKEKSIYVDYTLVDDQDDQKEVLKKQSEWESILFNAPSMLEKASFTSYNSKFENLIDKDNIALSFESIKSIHDFKTKLPVILENIYDFLEIQIRKNSNAFEDHFVFQLTPIERIRYDQRSLLKKLEDGQDEIKDAIFKTIKESSNDMLGGTEVMIKYRNKTFLLKDSFIEYSDRKKVSLYIVKDYEKIIMQSELFVWDQKGPKALSYKEKTPWPIVKALAIKYIDDLSN